MLVTLPIDLHQIFKKPIEMTFFFEFHKLDNFYNEIGTTPLMNYDIYTWREDMEKHMLECRVGSDLDEFLKRSPDAILYWRHLMYIYHSRYNKDSTYNELIAKFEKEFTYNCYICKEIVVNDELCKCLSLTDDEIEYELGSHDCGQNPYCSCYRGCSGDDKRPIPNPKKLEQLKVIYKQNCIELINKSNLDANVADTAKRWVNEHWKIYYKL